MHEDVIACADLVRRGDPDRFRAVMAAPVAARERLFPVYAFNLEVSRAPWVTEEPMVAEMRLQWWRDALGEIREGGPVRRHEVATPLSGVVDVTPFIVYFNDNVYDKIIIKSDGMDNALFQEKLSEGMITVKEKELWHFVSANYGEKEFSTKQLEKDFGNAAYATIRGFVLKFSEMGLLASQQYGNRVRYKKVY